MINEQTQPFVETKDSYIRRALDDLENIKVYSNFGPIDQESEERATTMLVTQDSYVRKAIEHLKQTLKLEQ